MEKSFKYKKQFGNNREATKDKLIVSPLNAHFPLIGDIYFHLDITKTIQLHYFLKQILVKFNATHVACLKDVYKAGCIVARNCLFP